MHMVQPFQVRGILNKRTWTLNCYCCYILISSVWCMRGHFLPNFRRVNIPLIPVVPTEGHIKLHRTCNINAWYMLLDRDVKVLVTGLVKNGRTQSSYSFTQMDHWCILYSVLLYQMQVVESQSGNRCSNLDTGFSWKSEKAHLPWMFYFDMQVSCSYI